MVNVRVNYPVNGSEDWSDHRLLSQQFNTNEVFKLYKKLYSSTEQELVFDWADKWFELSHLINGLIWTDDPPGTTPPLTEVDELEYQRLRFWFLDHQKQFILIWVDYYNCKSGVCTEDFIIENVEEFLATDEFIKNPFYLFYRAENLHRFAQQLELQSGVDIWEPSHNYASATMSLIIFLGKIMIEIIDWVDERIWLRQIIRKSAGWY